MRSWPRGRSVGISLLIVALLLHAFNTALVPSLLQEGPEAWGTTERIISFLFNEIGINAIIIVITVIGASYLLIGDLLFGFLSDRLVHSFADINQSVSSGFSEISRRLFEGVVNLNRDLVMAWVRNKNGSPQDYLEVGMAALKESYDHHVSVEDNYIEFSKNTLFDATLLKGSVYRSDLKTSINLQRPAEGWISGEGLLMKDYILWDEHKSYHLVTETYPIDYTFITTTRFPISKDHIIDMLCKSTFHIKILQDKLIDLHDIIPILEKEKIETGEIYATDDGSVSFYFDGTHANFKFRKDMVLSQRATFVETYEKTSFHIGDDSYALSSKTPVKGFDFVMRLGPMLVESVNVSCSSYFQKEKHMLAISDWSNKRDYVSARTTSWLHPGILIAVDWAPKADMEIGQ